MEELISIEVLEDMKRVYRITREILDGMQMSESRIQIQSDNAKWMVDLSSGLKEIEGLLQKDIFSVNTLSFNKTLLLGKDMYKD